MCITLGLSWGLSDFNHWNIHIATYVIATTASKSSELTSIAGCSTYSSFGYRVNSVNSMFTVEALAIGTAVDELVLFLLIIFQF